MPTVKSPVATMPTVHPVATVKSPVVTMPTVKSPVATVQLDPYADEATKSRADYKLRIRHSDRKEDP